jgi:hypothetical protein
MTEPGVDQRLDAVLADMTRVGSDPAFRARVLQRIEAETSHRAGWRRPQPLGPAYGGLAAVVVSLVVLTAGWLAWRGLLAPWHPERQEATAVGSPGTAPTVEPEASAPQSVAQASARLAAAAMTRAGTSPVPRATGPGRQPRQSPAASHDLLPRPPAVSVETVSIEPLALPRVGDAEDFAPIESPEPVRIQPLQIAPVDRRP